MIRFFKSLFSGKPVEPTPAPAPVVAEVVETPAVVEAPVAVEATPAKAPKAKKPVAKKPATAAKKPRKPKATK